MLVWIDWNRTVNMSKIDLALNNLQYLICYKINQPTNTLPTKPNLHMNLQVLANQQEIGFFSKHKMPPRRPSRRDEW